MLATDRLDATTNISARDWPMNAWYAAAWDHEVQRSLLARTVAGRSLVLYRTSDDSPVALADACWHRLVPLSMGKLCGDEVQCGYHGIRFGSDGMCTHMPAQETINPSAAVASYPTVQRHRLVWVWPGNPAKADPDLIPDLYSNDHPEWAGDGRMISLDVNYQLVLDNLMDLTHEEFVHTTTIGSDHLSVAPFETHHEGDTVTVTRWMLDIAAPPFLQHLLNLKFPDYRGPVDRWQIISYTAPATIVIDVGVAKAGTGAPQGDRSQGISGWVINTMTPTTADSCMYHWSFNRDVAVDRPDVTAQITDRVSGVFGEDEVMLRAQQSAIDNSRDYQFYNINIDAGGMWVRRTLKRMIDDERL